MFLVRRWKANPFFLPSSFPSGGFFIVLSRLLYPGVFLAWRLEAARGPRYWPGETARNWALDVLLKKIEYWKPPGSRQKVCLRRYLQVLYGGGRNIILCLHFLSKSHPGPLEIPDCFSTETTFAYQALRPQIQPINQMICMHLPDAVLLQNWLLHNFYENSNCSQLQWRVIQ